MGVGDRVQKCHHPAAGETVKRAGHRGDQLLESADDPSTARWDDGRTWGMKQAKPRPQSSSCVRPQPECGQCLPRDVWLQMIFIVFFLIVCIYM